MNVQAQLNVSDSLFLVEFFEQTGGPDWANNDNWLNGPAVTWHGVILTPDQTQVEAIILPKNNLHGQIPPSIQNLFSLNFLDVFGNCLAFIPDLTLIPSIQFANLDSNKLGYASVIPYGFCGNPNFVFCNQNLAGEVVDTIVSECDTICLFPNVDGIGNIYQWFHDGVTLPPSSIQPDGKLQLDSIQLSQGGSYSFIVFNDFVAEMVIEGVVSFIEVAEKDSTGALIKARQLIIKFTPGIAQASKDSIRNEFMATPLDSILCKDIDLWGFPDSIILPGTDTLIEIEEIKNRVGAKSKVEEVNYNHVVEEVDHFGLPSYSSTTTPSTFSGILSQDSIVIAIIDTGLDTGHTALNPLIWYNPGEIQDFVDNDGNCIIDDVVGFNFMDKTSNIVDENGHGTHVAGIIKDQIIPGNNVQLMGLRTHDAKGRGSIFAMMSAIFYASSQNARVINISSGYSGESSSILQIAIKHASDSSQSVVVCSAGNAGIDNDTLPHYPSSLDVKNILSVAALDSAQTDLAFYTNFGRESVDIAAPGTAINSTLPGNLMGVKSGSSMATAWASGVLSNVILSNPDLTAEQIVHCVKNTADFFAGGIDKLSSEGTINEAAAISCLNSILPGIRMRAYLQGPFVSDSAGMTSDIFNKGDFPTTEPFSVAGWPLTEGSGDTIDFTQMNLNPVDWAVIELRDKVDSSTIFSQRPVIIRTDGMVVMPNADSILSFQGLIEDQYFITLRTFRHMGVLTQTPHSVTRTHPQFDFTTTGITTIMPDIFETDQYGTTFILCGDANQDNVIDASDRSATWNGRNQTGYLFFDVNLDGVCDASDRSITWNNRNKSAGFPP
jgi:hypothetical protein